MLFTSEKMNSYNIMYAPQPRRTPSLPTRSMAKSYENHVECVRYQRSQGALLWPFIEETRDCASDVEEDECEKNSQHNSREERARRYADSSFLMPPYKHQ